MSELHLSQQNATDTPNGTTVPSQEEHADALGVASFFNQHTLP